jgi:hypothetical protein
MAYKNPQDKIIYDKKYYLKNKNKIKKANREYRKTERGQLAHKNGELKRKFGITLDEYDDIFNEQGGVCLICHQPEFNRRLAVDHEHQTGKIRGLLCTRCNHIIGYLEKKPELIKKFLDYINYE